MKKINYLFVLLAFLSLGISANAQLLRLNVQPGQMFTQDVNLTTTLDIKAKDSNMSLSVPISARLNYFVASNNANTTIVSAELADLKIDFDFMGKGFHFDSKKDSAANGESALLFELLNKPFEIHYNNRRKITNIVGLNNIFKSIEKKSKKKKEMVLVTDSIAPAESKEIVITEEETFAEDSLAVEEIIAEEYEVGQKKEDNDIFAFMFAGKSDEEKRQEIEKIYDALSFFIFPENEIKKGMKWEKRFERDGISSVTSYKVTEMSNSQTTISSNTKNHIDFNKLLKELKWKADVKIKKHASSGQMIFDNQTGWLKSLISAYLFSATINMEGKKGAITLAIKYDTSVEELLTTMPFGVNKTE